MPVRVMYVVCVQIKSKLQGSGRWLIIYVQYSIVNLTTSHLSHCNFPNSAQKEEEEEGRPQDLSGVCREGEGGG
jgi:hypothetical protein